MFYDLEDPLRFMREVRDVLADDGVWVFEQSYMPAMLEANAYDTVCHEHLEFYALEQVQWMARRAGLRLLDVEFNDVNGGSFSVTAMKANVDEAPLPAVQAILDRERALGLHTLAPYQAFAERVSATRAALRAFVHEVRASGKIVAALGASTKGNVLLQYCGFGPADIVAVGEVNPDKVGCVTPGTWLPILAEDVLLACVPDYLLVLPWHFRAFFLANPKFAGSALVFPLPQLEIVPARR
jgi:NDP-4-keto-2,6-dideoxyhexose 3-C-methyltransferase